VNVKRQLLRGDHIKEGTTDKSSGESSLKLGKKMKKKGGRFRTKIGDRKTKQQRGGKEDIY